MSEPAAVFSFPSRLTTPDNDQLDWWDTRFKEFSFMTPDEFDKLSQKGM